MRGQWVALHFLYRVVNLLAAVGKMKLPSSGGVQGEVGRRNLERVMDASRCPAIFKRKQSPVPFVAHAVTGARRSQDYVSSMAVTSLSDLVKC
jgi:hypothetical protein